MMFDKDEISFIAQRAPETRARVGIAGRRATDFREPDPDRAPASS
jgi:hypothetical protein